MAEWDWALLCDHAFYDEKGKPCLIGIFRAISVKSVPTTHPSVALAFSLRGDPDEAVDVRIRLLGPEARDPLIDIGSRTELGPGGQQITVVNLLDLPLPDDGSYEFRLSLDSRASETSIRFMVAAEKRNGK